MDELGQYEVTLDPGSCLRARGSTRSPDLIPTGVVTHEILLYGYRRAQSLASAREISMRPLLRCFWNVVSNTTRPSWMNL